MELREWQNGRRYWGWASKREKICYYRVAILKLIQVSSECNPFIQLCQEEHMRQHKSSEVSAFDVQETDSPFKLKYRT